MTLLGQAKLPRHESEGWRVLLNGGILRHGDYFISNHGISDFYSFDYVNGYNYGPELTLGKVRKDLSRLEIDINTKYADSRNVLMSKGAVRYVLKPEYNGFFEVFGGQFTSDFDHQPMMNQLNKEYALVLFGWDKSKLYEQTSAGVKGSIALNEDFQIKGQIGWERRRQLQNYRLRNTFRKKGNPNIPKVQHKNYPDFETDNATLFETGLVYSPGRQLFMSDDLTLLEKNSKPIYSLKVSGGVNHKHMEFLSLELATGGTHSHQDDGYEFGYYASAGFFPVRNNVLLMDYHHFDATHFLWQTSYRISWFSLLDEYELSTSKSWIEGHVEWDWQYFYTQAHAVKVPDMPSHEEISCGMKYGTIVRLGLSIGFDDASFDGVAFNFIYKI